MSEFAPGPDRARPPGTVRISSYLLYVTAAVAVASMAVSLSTLSTVREVYRDAYAGTEIADSIDTFAVAAILALAVPALLVAVGLVVLGFLNLRGKNVARIITWVVGGLYLICCGGLSLYGLAGGAMSNTGTVEGGPSAEDVRRQLTDALPGWYTPANLILTALPLLLVLAALILLALPASNEWFKPQAATWEPPTPGYPVMPGSSYPTFPTQGGEPPLPPAPPVTPPASGGEPPETPAPPR